jgi:predicted RNA-binding protein with PIN domain
LKEFFQHTKTGEKVSERRIAKDGMPHYIIDGYNVVFNREEFRRGRNLEESREVFCRLLDSYASGKKVEITVVWDGSGNPGAAARKTGRIKNVYSSSGMNADEKIIRFVQRAHNKGRITVVTDDRQIIGTVRYIGAQVKNVNDFLSLVGRPKRTSKIHLRRRGGESDSVKEKVSADDLSVDEWMRLFSAGEK